MPILSLCTGYKGLDMAVEALTGDKTAYEHLAHLMNKIKEEAA